MVELPEDDPDVLERFLQFLYTGSYDDGVSLRRGQPDDVCMLSSDEVAAELNMAPGVNVSPSETRLKWEAVDGAQQPTPDVDTQTEDESYHTESPSPSEEPEEEYNEFHGDGDADSGGPDLPTKKRLAELEKQLGCIYEARMRLFKELQVSEALFLPLRLYIMADKFDVPALKLLARDRFYRAAEMAWTDAECFPAVVDELYTNTPDSDIAMREIVCRLVGTSILDDDQRARMDAVMRKHGDFAVGVMNYLIVSKRTVWA